MRLTKRLRAQVVELLRCAADLPMPGIAGAFELLTGTDVLGAHYQPGGRGNYPVWNLAVKAREDVAIDSRLFMDYQLSCLEAAQLVEEGSWP